MRFKVVAWSLITYVALPSSKGSEVWVLGAYNRIHKEYARVHNRFPFQGPREGTMKLP